MANKNSDDCKFYTEVFNFYFVQSVYSAGYKKKEKYQLYFETIKKYICLLTTIQGVSNCVKTH